MIIAGNLLLIAVLLEVGTRFIYPWIRGGDFSWATLRDELRKPDSVEEFVIGDPAAGAPSVILHPYIGFTFEPGSTLTTRDGSPLQYSRFGFFGEDPVFERAPGEIIVAIGGGSVAGGLWHRGGDTLRATLQADPRFQGKTIRLQSFALGGFKQPQPLNTLVYLLALGAKFDVWIELDGFNEIALPLAENAPSGIPTDYPRDWRRLSRSGVSSSELGIRAEIYALRRDRERRRVLAAQSPWVFSAFIAACWDTADRRSAARIAEMAASLAATAPQSEAPNENEVLHESVTVWKNASIQMARLCAANGIAYYQFIQPNQYFPATKTFSEEEQRTALAKGGYQPPAEKGYPLLVAAGEELREQGVPVFDLTTIFRDEPRTIYRDSCCHLNELGNDLLARRIAEIIVTAPTAASN